MTCERCKHLNELLQRERQQVVVLKDKVETSRSLSCQHKKALDDAMLSQAAGTDMVKTAVQFVLRYLGNITESTPEKLPGLLGNMQARTSLLDKALNVLNHYQKGDAVHKLMTNRKREEHAMPRRGKHSS